jgi:hypothetical protein
MNVFEPDLLLLLLTDPLSGLRVALGAPLPLLLLPPAPLPPLSDFDSLTPCPNSLPAAVVLLFPLPPPLLLLLLLPLPDPPASALAFLNHSLADDPCCAARRWKLDAAFWPGSGEAAVPLALFSSSNFSRIFCRHSKHMQQGAHHSVSGQSCAYCVHSVDAGLNASSRQRSAATAGAATPHVRRLPACNACRHQDRLLTWSAELIAGCT